jgi:hypothetical protein
MRPSAKLTGLTGCCAEAGWMPEPTVKPKRIKRRLALPRSLCRSLVMMSSLSFGSISHDTKALGLPRFDVDCTICNPPHSKDLPRAGTLQDVSFQVDRTPSKMMRLQSVLKVQEEVRHSMDLVND